MPVFACPAACPTYNMRNNTSALGGTLQNDLDSLGECRLACERDSSCRGLDADYTTGSFRCWLHLGPIGNTVSRNGVYHYTLVERCPGGCTLHSWGRHWHRGYLTMDHLPITQESYLPRRGMPVPLLRKICKQEKHHIRGHLQRIGNLLA